ncbi:MAG: alpha/beta fold hydrolase [Patescibacteria group bacterium]
MFEVIESIISNNFAKTIGGAIYSNHSGEIILRNTEISNNSANNEGGAIFDYAGLITIDRSCISGNSSIAVSIPVDGLPTAIISAPNNYWGHESGPSGVGPGSGDSISSNVNYLPFLADCPPPPSPSPSPSPSPEPSILPSPLPSPQPTKTPVVMLPGFGGSWNTQALISGGDEGIWKKTPFVKIYDNLKQTFLNAGYTEGQNYFELYYDWRKPLDNLADQLKNFLETTVLAGKPENTKINFIGHSMGGLVARTYGQKYGIDKINELVTVGSSHQGAIPAWRLWSGADVDDHWSFSRLGLQLYLQLQKGRFDSPVAAIQALSPSLQDLTPTFDFAKKNNLAVPINTMSFTNNYLAELNNALTPNLKNIFNIVYGEAENNTVEWVNLGTRSLADRLLGRWPDGRPIDYLFTPQGDLTVLAKSAIINEVGSIATVSGNHSEIVSEADGIQAILNALDLTQVVPSTATASARRNPLLFFFLHSPAQIKVTSAEGLEAGFGSAATLPDTIYSEEDKLLLIQNALSDYYQTEIVGQGNGVYGLEIGQLTDESDNWFNIENNINQGESDFFEVNLTQVKPANPLELTIYQLNKIKNSASSKKLIKRIEAIIRKLNLQRQNGLLDIIDDIYSLDYKISELDKAGKWLIETIEEPVKDRLKILTKLITAKEIITSEKFLESMKNKIDQKIKSENPEIGTRLELAEEYLAKAKADFEKGLYRRARAERKIVKIILHKIL